MSKFTWIPLYEELATKLLDWEGRQPELIKLLQELAANGVPVGRVSDEAANGEIELVEIDPFTFFGTFNRNMKPENRQAILRRIKERLGLLSAVPDDFHGIPVVNNLKAWFIPYATKREPDDVSALWALARKAVLKGADGVDAAAFDRCLKILNVGITKLTMGLFWMRPRQFLPLDKSTQGALKAAKVASDAEGFADYRDLLKSARSVAPDFAQLAASAYHTGPAQPVESATLPAAPRRLRETGSRLSGPLNVILYGPPGTGKTHRMQQEARAMVAGTVQESPLIDELGWFEIIVASLLEMGGRSTVPRLITHRFLVEKHRRSGIRTPLSNIAWAQLQQHTVKESTTVDYARRSGVLVFDRNGEGDWIFARGEIPEDLREVHRRLVASEQSKQEERFQLVTFHQSFSYEDFIEGIRPVLSREDDAELRYELKEGVFLRACEEAIRVTGYDKGLTQLCLEPAALRRELFAAAEPYALFIDEINRGNVSRVFGELISLIEPSKRLGAEHEMIVTLPYSQRRFGVPLNLKIVGAMNTADRSIEALDTALRRRFEFEHLRPDPAQLEGIEVEGVDIPTLLRTINARLRTLLDPGHAIGHAYFWPLKSEPTLENLKRIFGRQVLPLLEEYFHSEPRNLLRVLGPAFVVRDSAEPLLGDAEASDWKTSEAAVRLVDFSELGAAAFASIYAKA